MQLELESHTKSEGNHNYNDFTVLRNATEQKRSIFFLFPNITFYFTYNALK